MVKLKVSSIRKNFWKHFPWGMFCVLLLWISLGLLNLYSATYKIASQEASSLFYSQLIWMGVGLGMLFLLLLIDVRKISHLAYPFFLLSIFLLILVLFFGRSVAGQQNWLTLGSYSFQPSEVAKISLIIALAKYYGDSSNQKKLPFSFFVPPFLLMFVPLVLVVLERDMGGAIFFVLIFASMTFLLRISWKFYAVLIVVLCLTSTFTYHYLLKDYQKARMTSFLNPEADPKGKGYHLLQSKIAVGSGGILGEGYLKGQINKLKFLPERHTDFIFSVFAEEWGFLGSIFYISLMLTFFYLGIQASFQSRDHFGSFLSFGIVSLLFWHFAINLGGVLGVIPLTGVVLPLMSYGGSSVLTVMIAIALLLNVRMRRYFF